LSGTATSHCAVTQQHLPGFYLFSLIVPGAVATSSLPTLPLLPALPITRIRAREEE